MQRLNLRLARSMTISAESCYGHKCKRLHVSRLRDETPGCFPIPQFGDSRHAGLQLPMGIPGHSTYITDDD